MAARGAGRRLNPKSGFMGDYISALRLTEYLRLDLTSMLEPSPGPEDVLLRVRACGICGGDV